MNLTAIRADTRYIATGDRTNTAYSDTDLDANINHWYNLVLSWILGANGSWQVNEDYATASIVASQREYILPADILKLNKVYIKSVSTGEYVEAKHRELRNVTDYPEDYHPATPEYDLMDNSLFIYLPEDITAVTDGIKIYYQTNLTELSGASDTPNLPTICTRILSFGAANDYCLANEMWNKSKKLENRIFGDPTVRNDQGLKGELEEYYANRISVEPPIITPFEENLY